MMVFIKHYGSKLIIASVKFPHSILPQILYSFKQQRHAF